MFIQVEISTHCNFTCFYCAGRDMEQAYMSMDAFQQILRKLPDGQHLVCLQGEGEPTLHPKFWEMAAHVEAVGHIPYTITNGSRADAKRFAAQFPTIAVSIDTLDPREATKIGRKNLAKVLRNFDQLLAHMGPDRLIVTTVDYGQPLDDLIAFVKDKKVAQHMIQPLQVKADYRKRYPDRPAPQENYTYYCKFLAHDLHRTYDKEGHVFPCCHIKDSAHFESIEVLRSQLARKEVPRSCLGCREILSTTKQPRLLTSTPVTPPKLSFVMTCKGRLNHVQRSISSLSEQTGCEVVFVDYGCEQQSSAWVMEFNPSIRVITVNGVSEFNKAHACNIGAAHASGEWICFIDADVVLISTFFGSIQALLQDGVFLQFSEATPGLVVCRRADFAAIHGFDETFRGWGCEDNDLLVRLAFLRRQKQFLPSGLFSIIDHEDNDRTKHHSIADKWLSLRINGMYFQIKTDLARHLGVISLPPDELTAIYRQVRDTVLSNPNVACEIRIDLPPQTEFRQPPNWRLKRQWLYRFLPEEMTIPYHSVNHISI